MVKLSGVLYKTVKKTWIDSLRVYVKGGHGGNGLPSIGGAGGPGGSVLISPSRKVKSLMKVYKDNFDGEQKQRLVASSGNHSSRSIILGQSGEDITFQVPLGIQIFDDHQRLLKDLDSEEVLVKVAAGGNGGCSQNGWIGQPGQSRHIRLDLKIIADVGLVGFPNAGKSTLLKAISRAKPKIASYPFTTIQPNLGEVLYSSDMRRIVLADLPGLIEGASYNVGMGHRFLKHLERTRLLLFIIDVNGFKLKEGGTYRSAFETLVLLNKEIQLYNPDLLEKPCVCVFNKMDTEGSEEKFKELEGLVQDFEANAIRLFGNQESCPNKFLQFSDILPISAEYSPKSVMSLKSVLRSRIDEFSDKGNRSLKTEESISEDLQSNDQWTHPELIISSNMKLK
uniref:GTP-binding protein 10 homolog n=1 Tax=Caligus clemensi TaxID=344056 RepID=C1BZW9_CALCM|nr:GTP-binding protein 10 homolog [Caligus clemensi]